MERTPTVMKKSLLALTLAATTLLAGCVLVGDRLDQARVRFGTLPFHVFDNAPGYVEPAQINAMDERVNVAICISGGGTPAAVFAAGIMEQLAATPDPNRPGRSVLDTVDVVSGVSGGSLAAAYYSLRKPDTFADAQETAAFFQRFKSEMTVDFVMRGGMHYLSHPWEGAMRYYTRYRFGQTLANTFDQYLFGGATFGDIHRRELDGRAPALIINSASMDYGTKFIFSNLNVNRNFAVDERKAKAAAANLASGADRSRIETLATLAAKPFMMPFGFDGIDSDISSFRLASAITASSAFPMVPGPTALINYRNNTYVHLADGGINDNYGIDSVVQLYLSRLQHSRSAKRLVIISIDAANAPQPKKVGDPTGYVGAIAYGARAQAFSAARGQQFADALYSGEHDIRLVTYRLSECAAAKKMDGPKGTYCISEKDFHMVLNAAVEAAALRNGEVARALAGR